MDWMQGLRAEVERAAARAMGEGDAGPHSPTAGCFDRRYWAWKLVDFPEATFQRLVLPLAILYRDPASRLHDQPEVLSAIRSGLAFAARIQHPNGSFDQAFPFEQSFGATAFLVYPLLEAASLVDDRLEPGERASVAHMARQGAGFLCAHDERHGVIANHLAGAALSLVVAAERLGDERFARRADTIVGGLIARQSPEGWFPEYDGADPGYQTLCLDYLSEIQSRRPSAPLAAALESAVGFLRWFVHPDGTFGGIYGSRRTSLVYLGGLARLGERLPAARALCRAVGASVARGDQPGPAAMDIGNLAPMLTSAVRALAAAGAGEADPACLPCEWPEASADFAGAGIYVRGTARYYAVVGASNGGTVSVFARGSRQATLDDGGYVAALADGALVTTQVTRLDRRVEAAPGAIEIEAAFCRMPSAVPTPGRFLVLRALCLTVMRSIALGNWMKRRLVRLLMTAGATLPVTVSRRVEFGETGLVITDRIGNPDGLSLRWMTGGQPFSGIHMASAGYFAAARLGTATAPRGIDVARLMRERSIDVVTEV